MTTILFTTGEVDLPAAIREKLSLLPGDDFEVFVEEENSITLRRVTSPANNGLAELLSSCPAPFEVPDRERDSTPALHL